MSAEERSLRVIEFSGKKNDWKSWSGKFLAHGCQRGYKMLLVGEGKTVGVDKVPTESEYEMAEQSSVQDDAVKNLGKLNVLTGTNGCGKSNLYRSLMLLHGSANGRFSEMIAEEGGMPSVLWAGQSRGNGPVQMEISVSFDNGLNYSVACGLPDKNSVPEVFRRDPQIKREQISIKKSVMVDRSINGVSLRASDGEKVHLPMSLSASESVLAQIVDPERFPAITNTRNAFASWRFYHGFRTDTDSPLRRRVTAPLPTISAVCSIGM